MNFFSFSVNVPDGNPNIIHTNCLSCPSSNIFFHWMNVPDGNSNSNFTIQNKSFREITWIVGPNSQRINIHLSTVCCTVSQSINIPRPPRWEPTNFILSYLPLQLFLVETSLFFFHIYNLCHSVTISLLFPMTNSIWGTRATKRRRSPQTVMIFDVKIFNFSNNLSATSNVTKLNFHRNVQ